MSLEEIAKAASKHFGQPISKSATFNLMQPPRQNSVNTIQRGEVNCKVCRTVCGEKFPHERASCAAALVKSLRQLCTMLAHRRAVVREFSVDHLRKYPFWISATSGASPMGHICVSSDGLPEFSVLDHDTPVGPRMLLTTGGVEEMTVSSQGEALDEEKPQLEVSSNGTMTVLLRPQLYLPVDAVSNSRVFSKAFGTGARADLVLVQSDNGWDYSMHSMLQQHLMLRNVFSSLSAMFVWCSQAL